MDIKRNGSAAAQGAQMSPLDEFEAGKPLVPNKAKLNPRKLVKSSVAQHYLE
jgi:hypothetical protein